MPLNQKCFCGADSQFTCCCLPFINNEKRPTTAEQLMRSRFSAYVIANGQYIFDTYDKSSQASQSVKDINDWSESCQWLALQIHATSDSNDYLSDNTTIESTEQFVEFSAFYITDDTLYELRENSRFVLDNIALVAENKKCEQQWRYIDGDIIKHDELAKIKRKELCPCNSFSTAWTIKKGKKYKQCCGS